MIASSLVFCLLSQPHRPFFISYRCLLVHLLFSVAASSSIFYFQSLHVSLWFPLTPPPLWQYLACRSPAEFTEVPAHLLGLGEKTTSFCSCLFWGWVAESRGCSVYLSVVCTLLYLTLPYVCTCVLVSVSLYLCVPLSVCALYRCVPVSVVCTLFVPVCIFTIFFCALCPGKLMVVSLFVEFVWITWRGNTYLRLFVNSPV